jgi:hypothetical protein
LAAWSRHAVSTGEKIQFEVALVDASARLVNQARG